MPFCHPTNSIKALKTINGNMQLKLWLFDGADSYELTVRPSLMEDLLTFGDTKFTHSLTLSDNGWLLCGSHQFTGRTQSVSDCSG